MSSWALALALVGAVAYAGACHELVVHAAGTPWAVTAMLGPMGLVVAGFAWRQRHWLLLGGLVVAFGGLLALVANGGIVDPMRLYLLQHVGIHVLLAASFGATLRQPVSMIGRFAQRLHDLTPAMVRYTRGVTIVWVAYFVGMAVVSPIVFVSCSREAWSLLANAGTPGLALALFVGEYLLRYRLNPSFERYSLRDSIRAYRDRAGAARPAVAAEDVR